MHEGFVSRLEEKLTGEMPGLSSQLKMVPETRRREIEGMKNSNNPRRAAVLICLYPDEYDAINLVLIRRNEYDGVHSGQISFPGGQYEEGDTDMIYTALREAEEETNIRMGEVTVLGRTTKVYIPPSNFIVTPVVGWVDHKPDLRPDPSEVSEILSVPLKEFLDPVNIQNRDIPHREFNIIDVPCFYINDEIIWGATAMMLMEFADIIRPLFPK